MSHRNDGLIHVMRWNENGGTNRSYMASEENFQAMKRIEVENRLVPLVGDFAGEKALRSVGRYVREHGATISTFYTSNVEFYLFQTDDWRKFFNTVSELPMNRESTMIRSYFNNYGLPFQNPPNWLASQNKFKCPCHGSGYYRTGVNFEGPAPRPLERAKIFLDPSDGQIVVDKSVQFHQERGEWTNPEAFIKV